MIKNEKCFIFGIYQFFNKKKESSIFESFNITILNKNILMGKYTQNVIRELLLKKVDLNDLKKLEIINVNGNDEIVLSKEINIDKHEKINNKKIPEHYVLKFRNRLEELLKETNLKLIAIVKN